MGERVVHIRCRYTYTKGLCWLDNPPSSVSYLHMVEHPDYCLKLPEPLCPDCLKVFIRSEGQNAVKPD